LQGPHIRKVRKGGRGVVPQLGIIIIIAIVALLL
jgi:hypothetical protein